MECQACGRQHDETAYRCDSCGAPLVVASWPDGTRCVVLLSFDVDGPSPMINRNPAVAQMPSTMSMGDYGPTVAVPRILDLLAEYGVPASCYFPGWIAERFPKVVERVAAAGHEIAHHGYLHEPPATLSRQEEAAVLDRTLEILEKITGARPRGYRSPSWELSEHSLELLAERGFLYDSSLMGHDLPYIVGVEERRLVEIPIHWSLDDYPYFFFTPSDSHRLMASPDHVFNVWATAFDELYERRGLFALTMHPFITGRPSRLAVLERLIRHIQGFPQVRFARAVDVAREFAQAQGIVAG
ncbi:MAG: polysaccharide deacetylase [Dehalococcoidia bacterium]